MLKRVLKAAGRPLWERLRFRIGAEIDRRAGPERAKAIHAEMVIGRLSSEVATLQRQFEELQRDPAPFGGANDLEHRVAQMIQQRIFLPTCSIVDEHAPFMQHSICSAIDFLHPRYREICAMLGHPPLYQRKLWEWVFIIHHLLEAGMLTEGRRGLVFGVGRERLPALFAKMGCEIVATDAPAEFSASSEWSVSGQHSTALAELKYPEIVPDEVFEARVTHQSCDMNAIDEQLTGFDFTWSSCCFEHLGDLEAGLQFVINSVEKTLKPGGIAVHTTEYNLGSNEDTLESGATVIYRKRDIDDLIRRLRERGHEVKPFIVAPHAHPLDFHIDAPPYGGDPHLKLRLASYMATSVGIVVRRQSQS
ncbi:class I SAM-dependent methyltransferase [Paraburkholderia sp. GAS82]|uniref:class I SAM-dependent methyltransferase n=1 Tax=Paraburkholderia sp. GAS82 TaxID=3035137 RepID=UPI003D1E044C